MSKGKISSILPEKSNFNKIYFYISIIIVFWTLLLSLSLIWNIHKTRKRTFDLVRNEAFSIFRKDIAFLKWSAGQGGVYLPVSENIKPNELLKNIYDRDIISTNGKKFTLVDPVYLIKNIINEYDRSFGVKSKITSASFLNQENMPDKWEYSMLLKFHKTTAESVMFTNINSLPYFRFIFPIQSDRSCQKCHSIQDINPGEIHGGMSVTIPLKNYFSTAKREIFFLVFSHLIVWIIGLGGLWLSIYLIKRQIKQREKLELEIKDRLFFLIESQTNELQTEIKTRAKIEKQLRSRAEELQKTNDILVDREHKMIALKKQLKELKSDK